MHRGSSMLTSWVALLVATAGCGGGGPSLTTSPPPPPPPPPPPAPSLQSIDLSPTAIQLSSGASQQFVSTARWSDGSATPGDVFYYATGGTITALGLYVAGPSPGAYSVIAADKTTGKADTSSVTVGAPSGSYTPEYADDFSAYADDGALRAAYTSGGRRIWNFGGIDWSKVNLVADPVFGKALRTTQQQQTPFFDLVNAPNGLPGAVQRTEVTFTKGALSGVWVRFYVRFDAPAGHPYGWRTKSPNDPSPFGGAYKVFFLHWSAPYSERGAIVFSNTSRLDAQFYVTGLAKVTEGALPGSGSSQGLTKGDGTEWRDGQWYEMIYHYKRLGNNIAQAGAWVRRYTANGQVNPGPYRWWMGQAQFVGQPPTASAMELGGNKNHGNEFDQYVIWGPWQVVDADKFANPFGVPMN